MREGTGASRKIIQMRQGKTGKETASLAGELHLDKDIFLLQKNQIQFVNSPKIYKWKKMPNDRNAQTRH